MIGGKGETGPTGPRGGDGTRGPTGSRGGVGDKGPTGIYNLNNNG